MDMNINYYYYYKSVKIKINTFEIYFFIRTLKLIVSLSIGILMNSNFNSRAYVPS